MEISLCSKAQLQHNDQSPQSAIEVGASLLNLQLQIEEGQFPDARYITDLMVHITHMISYHSSIFMKLYLYKANCCICIIWISCMCISFLFISVSVLLLLFCSLSDQKNCTHVHTDDGVHMHRCIEFRVLPSDIAHQIRRHRSARSK